MTGWLTNSRPINCAAAVSSWTYRRAAGLRGALVFGVNYLSPGPIPVDVVHLPTDTASVVLAWMSTVAVVLALIVALWAYLKIAKERRTVFELEVLRELLAMFDGSTRVTDARALALIEALPANDLVLWRNAANAVAGRPLAGEDARAAVAEVLDDAGIPPSANPDDRLWRACVNDLQNSISTRTGGSWQRIRRWYRSAQQARSASKLRNVDRLADRIAEKVANLLAQAAESSGEVEQSGAGPSNTDGAQPDPNPQPSDDRRVQNDSNPEPSDP